MVSTCAEVGTGMQRVWRKSKKKGDMKMFGVREEDAENKV